MRNVETVWRGRRGHQALQGMQEPGQRRKPQQFKQVSSEIRFIDLFLKYVPDKNDNNPDESPAAGRCRKNIIKAIYEGKQ